MPGFRLNLNPREIINEGLRGALYGGGTVVGLKVLSAFFYEYFFIVCHSLYATPAEHAIERQGVARAFSLIPNAAILPVAVAGLAAGALKAAFFQPAREVPAVATEAPREGAHLQQRNH